MTLKTVACLAAALFLLPLIAPAANAEPGWTPRRKAAQEKYLACKMRLSKEPPCMNVWTRHCAQMCGSRY